MNKKQIRWQQKFNNFRLAFNQLEDAVKLFNERELSLIEKQGLIQAFEFTHELSWNVLKDYLEYQGNFNIRGSRDAVKKGFEYNLIYDGEVWMQMIETRNITTHTYDKSIVDKIINEIINKYFDEFKKFAIEMKKLRDENEK
jgi:nucleotidyltransferase substrate binding protein (TIGR01987 family)